MQMQTAAVLKNIAMSFATMTFIPLSSVVAQAAPMPMPNDAQIASIVMTANENEIKVGQLALEKSKDSKFTSFAQSIIDRHKEVNMMTMQLAHKLKLEPETNQVSMMMQDRGGKGLAYLATFDGVAFERAYVDHEVNSQMELDQSLKMILIPNAKNEELKSLLMRAERVVWKNLKDAKNMQRTWENK